MPQATNYDVIVIGTSQGARFLPMTFAKAGRKVAVIERGHLGGVCVNFGCTPTKTMVASARVAYLARRGAEYGVRTGPVSVDLQAVRKRKQGMVEGARNNFKGGITAVQGLDLDLLRGFSHGRRNAGDHRAANLYRYWRQAEATRDQRSRECLSAQFNHDHGTGRAPRTPIDHWWRLHRARVWTDVSPLRKPGHDHSASSTLADERG